jgi:methionyl-tRNA formyltransferase
MRIILVGQAAFAEQVLQRLVARGDQLPAVYCPPDRPGGKPDPVKNRASEFDIPVYQHASLKGPEVAEEFRGHEADLTILAYVTQIVPASVIGIPRLGTICFHPSLLPRYRGGSAVNWQLINGEARTGVTVFWTDAGIDTGPIIVQKEAAVPPDATAGSLYYDVLFPLGVDAVIEAVDLIDDDEAPRIVQDENAATYDPLCRDEHAGVSWERPARDVYNQIRGCDPQPGAFTHLQGRKLRLYDARYAVEGAGGSPGTITSIDADGIRIAAQGGVVCVGRVRPDDARTKIAAAEFAQGASLAPGAVLI